MPFLQSTSFIHMLASGFELAHIPFGCCVYSEFCDDMKPLYHGEIEAIELLLPSIVPLCQPEAIKSPYQPTLFS